MSEHPRDIVTFELLDDLIRTYRNGVLVGEAADYDLLSLVAIVAESDVEVRDCRTAG